MVGPGAPTEVDEATIHIDAPPEAVYAVVSDITTLERLKAVLEGPAG